MRFGPVLIFLLSLSLTNGAQEAPSVSPQSKTVLHAQSQLVVLDVTVLDKKGLPVHGLDRSLFQVTEDKATQSVRSFEEHSTDETMRPDEAMPVLPPGYFMDHTPQPANGVLNVLLLDTLNTDQSDQALLQQQLRKYLSETTTRQRTAVFALSNSLYMLQGFSGDLQALLKLMDAKTLQRTSPLLERPVGMTSEATSPSGLLTHLEPYSNFLSSEEIRQAKIIQNFSADSASLQKEIRIQTTLDALNSLARYLSGLPGRKNLIWFAGSFPVTVLHNAAFGKYNTGEMESVDEFRQTTNLLARAQVAIYPVDAGGLRALPNYTAENGARVDLLPQVDPSPNSKTGVLNDPTTTESAQTKFENDEIAEHNSMERLAQETGGRAFYNSNALGAAFGSVLKDGCNFYTISYSPSNRSANGEYRSIHVQLSGSATSHGYKLLYRRGYYADISPENKKKSVSALKGLTNSEQHAAAAYTKVAMAFGAPQPEDILFEARVLPASHKAEQALASDNNTDAKHPMKPPFHRIRIDCAALPAQFDLVLKPDKKRSGAVEVLAYVYNSDGRLLNIGGQTIKLNLTEDEQKSFMAKPVAASFDVSVPLKEKSYIRLAMRDVPSNRYGVLELPTEQILKLPPLQQDAARSTPVSTP